MDLGHSIIINYILEIQHSKNREILSRAFYCYPEHSIKISQHFEQYIKRYEFTQNEQV